MCGQGFCILYFSRPNWGVHASLRGNDLPTSFPKTVILHFDTLLKLFNYHYFALSLWSHCDPLFGGFSGFLPSNYSVGAEVEISCTIWVLWLHEHRLWSEAGRNFGGDLEDQLVSIFTKNSVIVLAFPVLQNPLGPSLGLRFSLPRALPNQFLRMQLVSEADPDSQFR